MKQGIVQCRNELIPSWALLLVVTEHGIVVERKRKKGKEERTVWYIYIYKTGR